MRCVCIGTWCHGHQSSVLMSVRGILQWETLTNKNKLSKATVFFTRVTLWRRIFLKKYKSGEHFPKIDRSPLVVFYTEKHSGLLKQISKYCVRLFPSKLASIRILLILADVPCLSNRFRFFSTSCCWLSFFVSYFWRFLLYNKFSQRKRKIY